MSGAPGSKCKRQKSKAKCLQEVMQQEGPRDWVWEVKLENGSKNVQVHFQKGAENFSEFVVGFEI